MILFIWRLHWIRLVSDTCIITWIHLLINDCTQYREPQTWYGHGAISLESGFAPSESNSVCALCRSLHGITEGVRPQASHRALKSYWDVLGRTRRSLSCSFEGTVNDLMASAPGNEIQQGTQREVSAAWGRLIEERMGQNRGWYIDCCGMYFTGVLNWHSYKRHAITEASALISVTLSEKSDWHKIAFIFLGLVS